MTAPQPPQRGARNKQQSQSPRIVQYPGNGGKREREARDTVSTNHPEMIPYAEEAELGLLASVLLDNEPMATCSYVEPDYFYRHAHQLVWTAYKTLYEAHTPIDPITLLDALEKMGPEVLEQVGGAEFVLALPNYVPTESNAPYWARIICERYALRVMIRVNSELANVSYRGNIHELQSAWGVTRGEIDELLSRLHLSADGDDGPRFRLKSVREMRNRPRPRWLFPGVLQERKRGLIYGDSNTGKSFMALDMGLSVATDSLWHGKQLLAGTVVYVCAEGVDGISARVDAWLGVHGLEDAPDFWVIDDSPNLLERGDVADVITQVNQALDEPPALIVFDTLAASMAGADENDGTDMGIAVEALKQVQRECVCTVLAVHHSGKDAEKGPRGSTKLRADVDTIIQIQKEETSDVLSFKCRKMRDAAYFPPMSFRLVVRSLDNYGDVTSCVPESLDADASATSQTANGQRVRRKQTASDKLFALMAMHKTPALYSDLLRAFAEECAMSKASFDKALRDLLERQFVALVNGFYQLVVPAETTPDA